MVDSAVFLPDQSHLQWSRFKYLRTQLGGDGSTYSEHMKDARFTIPTPHCSALFGVPPDQAMLS